MPITPERKVKNKVTAVLKAYGVYYFYPLSGGFGKAGVPDIICCVSGRFLAIECKAGGNTTTALQERNIEEIKNNGGIALVVNEQNTDIVEQVLLKCLSYKFPQTV